MGLNLIGLKQMFGNNLKLLHNARIWCKGGEVHKECSIMIENCFTMLAHSIGMRGHKKDVQ